jgi:hypothetical protein
MGELTVPSTSEMTSSAAATRLRQRAVVLSTLAWRLQRVDALDLYRFAGPDTWVGPSPQACIDDLRQRRTAILQQVDALHLESRRFIRTADELDAQSAALPGAH